MFPLSEVSKNGTIHAIIDFSLKYVSGVEVYSPAGVARRTALSSAQSVGRKTAETGFPRGPDRYSVVETTAVVVDEYLQNVWAA